MPFDLSVLSNAELWQAVEELRKRGHAIAGYDAESILEGPLANMTDDNGDEIDVPREAAEAFWDEHREAIEDAMCEAVYRYCESVEFADGKLEHAY